MDIPFESWYQAISTRRSIRTYNGQCLDTEVLEHLESLCEEFRPFRGVRASIVRDPPEGVFKGIIGSYGEIKNAPHLAAFIGDISVSEVQEATGYLGEGIILEATRMGLQTCWIGGFFRPERLERALDLEKNEKILAITPIGHGVRKKSTRDKFMSLAIRSRRRKPLEKLITNSTMNLPSWSKTALKAARLAPSAANRQPWRFTVEANSITVRREEVKGISRISRRLDCGIAMLHLEVGAMAHGVKGTWELLPEPFVARFSIN
ncbi:MAG: nitroreductase family protein [Candidatus Thorarchaeota archaeon]